MDKQGFDSTHEELFNEWLMEAIHANMVVAIAQPLPYLICDQVWVPYNKVLKTKINKVQKELFKPWTYTPDFIFYWNPKYLNIAFSDVSKQSSTDETLFLANQTMTGQYYSVIDVKASVSRFGQRDSDVRFPYNQKMMYQVYGIYVQKIIVYPQVKSDKIENTVFGNLWLPENCRQMMYYKRDYKRKGEVIHKEGDPKFNFAWKTVKDWVL